MFSERAPADLAQVGSTGASSSLPYGELPLLASSGLSMVYFFFLN